MFGIQCPSNRHAAQLMRLVVGLVLVLAGLPAAASLAQSTAQGTARVSVARANFRATCSQSADVMAALLEGAEVEILESVGGWYRVRHPASGVEGCLHGSVLGPVTPLPDVEPEDERREREAEVSKAEAREAELEAERKRREAELEARQAEREHREAELEAREAEVEQSAREVDRAARGARGGRRVTGYLDLNVGYATPDEDSLTSSGPVIQGRPPRAVPNSRSESEYQYGRDLTYGVAGGFLVARAAGGHVGGGASLTRATYSVDLDLQVSRPHSTLPVIIVRDRIATGGPDRTETVLHLHAVYAPPTAERLRVRLFLGPSVFRIEWPLWNAVLSRFPVNPPRMEIQRVEFGAHEETVVGGHAGADLTYFFSDVFGIGASAVFSRATGELSVSAQDPEEPLRTEVTLGGLSAMLGVRFRF